MTDHLLRVRYISTHEISPAEAILAADLSEGTTFSPRALMMLAAFHAVASDGKALRIKIAEGEIGNGN